MGLIAGSLELTRMIFVGGGLLALLYKRRFGVTPGAIIIPGLLAIILYDVPLAFVLVVTLSIICWAIAKLTIYRWVLDSRLAVLLVIVLSFVLVLVSRQLFDLSYFRTTNYELVIPTFILPGLFANAAYKYGLRKVVIGVLATTAIMYLLAIALAHVLAAGVLTHSAKALSSYQDFAYVRVYVTMPVSLAAEVLLVYFFRIRAGGYAIMPMLANYIITSPMEGLMIVVSIGLTVAVVHLIMRATKVIGLDRFVCCLFMGFICATIMDLIAIAVNIPHFMPSATAPIIIIAVISNDLILSPRKNFSQGILPAAIVASLVRLAV